MSTQESSQTSSGGAREVRKKASERLGQWVRKKYRLDQLLGVGGMASVYGATHRNGSRVAIKIMHAEFAREDAIKQRFLREGYVANKVDHNGRVAILDDDETEQGEPYLVMELLEGESLQQIWKRCRRKIPVLDALRIAGDVLDTLVPFHDQKIIHRDLKPANIFVTYDGVVKLLDFGVAQLREEGGEALTRAGTALGTPSYMSPEQAMGKSDQLDGRSDVFAVGATLYAILGGRRLHHGKSDNEAFILAATQPAPSLARSAPQLPVEVIALVDKALQWDRRRRFKNAGEMRNACRKLLGELSEMEDVDRTSVLPERMSVAPTMMDTPDARRMTSTAPDPKADERAAASLQVPDAPAGPGTRAGLGAPPPMPKRSAPKPMVAERTPGPHTPLSSPSHGPLTPLSSPSHGTGPYTPMSSPSHGAPPTAPGTAGGRQAMRTGTRIARPAARGSQPPIGEPRLESSAARRESESPPGDDKDKVVEIFRRLEKALPSLRHYGLEHPEGQQKVRAVHRCMLDALREDAAGVHWEVHPFCFSRGGETLWEPGPPYDLVPYGLASTGIESVSVLPGVTEEELQTFLRAVVLDPQHGVDDDIAAALWEAGLQHIQCKVRDDLAGNNARARVKFFDESEQVESDLRVELADVVEVMASLASPSLDAHGQAEASALALSADKESFWVAKASTTALQLDGALRTALSSQLEIDADEWRDRFFDVAVEAYADAMEREDTELLLEPMKRHSRQLAATALWQELFELHDTLLSRLASAGYDSESQLPITQALFSWPIVERAFTDARSDRVDPETRALLVEGLWSVVPALPSNLTAKFLKVADDIPGGELLDLALSYVEGTLAGNEKAAIELLDDLKPDLAQRVLSAIANNGDESVRELLKPLMASKNPALRCEATALLSQSQEMLAQHLVKLLSSGDPKLRMAALNTMTRHEVRIAGPALVRFVESETFATRPREEQAKVLEALHVLSAARAEKLCAELLDKHGMLADESLDQVRILAAETLGKYASGQEAIAPLDNATRLRPWNTQALRSAASAALAAVRTRMSDASRDAVSREGQP